jgi:hypothetical protein
MPFMVGRVEGRGALDEGVVGAGQVGRSADHLRYGREDLVEHGPGMLAGRRAGLGGHCVGDQLVEAIESALRQVAGQGAFQLGGLGRAGEALLPGLARLAAAFPGLLPVAVDVVRHHEGLVLPAHGLAGVGDLVVEQRVAVAVGVAFLAARAFRDLGLAGDHGRPVLARRPLQGLGDLAMVVAVHRLDRPAGGLEARDLVARLRDGRLAVDGGVVVVEQDGELGKLQAARQADRLVADPFHQATVAGDHPGAVVDEIIAEAGGQMTLGHGHADGGGEALAQRAGSRLDAGRVAILGMAGGVGAELPEVADLVHRHGLEAGQVEQGVDQHRAVAGREHEAVAVGPAGLRGVILQEPAPEHGGHVGHAHGHALVAGPGLVDGVHGQDADGVGHDLQRGGHRRALRV